MRIVIEVHGGCVTAVHTDAPGADVTVRDWDNIEAGDPDPCEGEELPPYCAY